MPRVPGHRTPAPLRVPSGCLLWRGRVDKNGYGKRGSGWAHRIAWEQANGRPVPEGYEIDHTCRTPLCVEPSHLDCITEAEHWERTHPRSATCQVCGAADWYERPDGGRQCRPCKSRQFADWRRRNPT